MFCDLVGSTRLTARGDNEEWLERWSRIKAQYLDACAGVIRDFGGHVHQRLGDGLLVFFGYPVAHEDDARRAVRAGLAVIEKMHQLNAQLVRANGISLQLRIGIDTGMVVFENDEATGPPTNIASRLQEQVAQPDTLVISGATHGLVRLYFTYEELGIQTLRNSDQNVRAFRVLAETDADGIEDRGLVGRERELATLLDRWERARTGEMHLVEITGEPGIGKSRLVKALRQGAPNCFEMRCSQLNANSPLFPVVKRLERLLGFERLPTAAARSQSLRMRLQPFMFSAQEIGLLAVELAVPPPMGCAVPELSPQEKRQQTLNALVRWFLAEARRAPLIAVWEDMHWADPTTIELTGMILAQARDVPLLLILTYRPGEFKPTWPRSATHTELQLTRLDPADVAAMIKQITSGRALPAEVVDQIVARTDGVPLYVEETLQMVLETGFVRDDGERYVISNHTRPLTIPPKLEGLLQSRLDRLGAAKVIAQRGAVIGRAFSEDLFLAVLDADTLEAQREYVAALDPDTLKVQREEIRLSARRCLKQLVDAGLLYERQGLTTTYEFKHALIQKAAYESLWRGDCRTHHLHTASVLETKFEQVADAQPEIVAYHYEAAAQHAKALDYWQKAGERARDRSANREAVEHFSSALNVLGHLPETEARDRRELSLLEATLTPLIAVDGYVASTKARVVERALKLRRRLGDLAGFFPVLYAQWVARLVRGDYVDARRLSEEFLEQAASQTDSAPLLMGHRLLGFSMFAMGDGSLDVARDHLLKALDLYDPARHADLKNQGYGQDPRCACEAFLTQVQWLRGDLDDAIRLRADALAHARAANHSNTWGYAMCFGAVVLDVFHQDAAAAEQSAGELLAFAQSQGLPVWVAYARVFRGWALAKSGRVDEGLAEMTLGLADFDYPSPQQAALMLAQRPQGMGFMKSFLLCLLAEVYAMAGAIEEEEELLETAWSVAVTTGEGFWKAEIARRMGEFIARTRRSSNGAKSPEAWMCMARDIAAAQAATMLELRAAASLVRLSTGAAAAAARITLAAICVQWPADSTDLDIVTARRLLELDETI